MGSVFLFVSLLASFCAAVDWKCTEEFCGDYWMECPQFSKDCRDKDKGIVLTSLDPCNCCEICITFLEKGKPCIKGSPGQVLPNVMCGPGLLCDADTGTCVDMLNPEDDPLTYPTHICDKGECHCVAPVKDHTPIYGNFYEANMTSVNETQCGCSIAAYKARNKDPNNRLQLEFNVQEPSPRCLPNGQYDPLQCSDSSCRCVNQKTGVLDETIKPVQVSALHETNPPCFNPARHSIGQYYTECELERLQIIADRDSASVDGYTIIDGDSIDCLPNGSYA